MAGTMKLMCAPLRQKQRAKSWEKISVKWRPSVESSVSASSAPGQTGRTWD